MNELLPLAVDFRAVEGVVGQERHGVQIVEGTDLHSPGVRDVVLQDLAILARHGSFAVLLDGFLIAKCGQLQSP